jgi:hypothetical protein
MNQLRAATNTIPAPIESINEYLAWCATTPINGTIDSGFAPSLDTSKIFSRLWSNFAHWFVPEVVLDKLDDIYKECSIRNWDGYGALPIIEATYREAETIIRSLPSFVPPPDILAEPDGGIGLDWDGGEGFSFTISVSGNNVLTYAGLFGDNNETYGTESLSATLPKIIVDNLERLFPEDK